MSAEDSARTWEQAVRWLRSQPDQHDLVLAGYYDDPVDAAADRYWRSAEWRSGWPLLPVAPGARVLEIGAGRGIASYALAKEGFEVVALEPDGSNLVGAGAIRALAERQQLPIAVKQQSVQDPEWTAAFDLVFGRAVLHHVPDLGTTCAELYRVLKPGGTLIVLREHVISRIEDLPRFQELHPLHRHYGGENAYLLERYTSALLTAGFRQLQVLAPLRSPINLAPQSVASIQAELARRVSLGQRALSIPGKWLLSRALIWSMLLPILEKIDHRPGRLYSFVARKPSSGAGAGS
jgi:2-polyprenyl-3-methyl-5-hydroxy-6-metoxy-1,4-benzoquinol methylase